MSHFTVAVILTQARLARHNGDVNKALKEILAPYDENACEEGNPYAKFNDLTDECLKEYETESDGENRPLKEQYPTFEQFAKDYHGYHQNADGRWGYWRNPDKKWDWYSIGGRWRGFFPVKDGVEPKIGQAGAFNNDPQERGSDVVKRSEIDFDRVAAIEKERFDEFKDEYRRLLKGEKFDVFDGPRDTLMSMGLLRVEKDPGVEVKATEVAGKPWGEEHGHIAGTDRHHWRDITTVLTDEELERYRVVFNPLRTYAALNDEGWHAPGEMGWFGVSSDEPDAYLAYAETFNEKFIKALGDDDLLVCVDCHI